MLNRFLLAFTLLVFSLKGYSSHVSGGDISYQYIGPNTYVITLNLFRDCSGITMSTAESITLSSTCGASSTFSLPLINTGGIEISQLCATQMPNSTCNGGTQPGMQHYIYQDTVTISPVCNTWTISWSLCCRNTAANVTSSSSYNTYLEATLNTLTDPTNSSPYFTAQPIPYVCQNQPVTYNYGVVETDGDSLVFSLVNGLSAAGTVLPYAAGYSGTAPIPGITINSQTGQIAFTPTVAGNFIVVIRVDEYNAAGQLIGTVMRDIQFVVQSCTNTVPNPSGGGISSLTGTATQTGTYSLEMCEGNSFTFTATFNDPNGSDVLTLTSNIASVLSGGTMTTSGTNPVTATVSWTAPAGTAGTNNSFTITVTDDACPVAGIQTMVYDINVLEATLAGPDLNYCPAGGALPITATGGSTFSWTPATGLSCTNCATTNAAPTVTTQYIVQSNLSGSCKNKDTVIVNVVPNFPMTVTPQSDQICLNEIASLSVSTNAGNGPFTYNWSPAAGLTGTNIPNPQASPTATTSYIVAVTSGAGCTQRDTVDITVSGVGPTVVVSQDSSICSGISVPLTSTAVVQPPFCGLASSACSGTTSTGTIGTGTTSTGYIGPYYGTTVAPQYLMRHQYIITAAELQAAGFNYGGVIESIAMELTSGNNLSYTGFTVKMGCTSLTQFPDGNYINGLSTVYYAASHSVNAPAGWKTITLQNPYNWDGTSNLIVEYCSSGNTGLNYRNVMYTSTSPNYYSIYDYSATILGCAEAQGYRTTIRPNFRLGICQNALSSPTYAWTPGTGLSSTSIPNVTATPGTTTTYTLNVTDNSSGCTGSGIATITVSPNYTVSTTPDASICYGNSTTLGVSTSGGGPHTYTWTPTGSLSSSTSSSPVASPGSSTTYYVDVSNGACTKRDSILVDVGGGPVSVSADQSIVCPGSTVQLNVAATPVACGAASGSCSGTNTSQTLGTGTTSSSTYSPFYGGYQDARYQFLVTAAELTAAGFSAGTITSMALNIITHSSTGPFNGFTIKMGCTSAAALSSAAWESAPVTVYGPVNYSVTAGINTFNLSTQFDWDGVSNLVIETCFDNSVTVGYDYPAYTTTAFAATARNYSTGSGCSLTPAYTYNARPNLTFNICTASLPAGATYAWTPSAQVSSTSSSSPTGTVPTTTNFAVQVASPSNPGCPSAGSVTVSIDSTNYVVASNDTTVCAGDPAPLNTTVYGPGPSTVTCGTNGTSCSSSSTNYNMGTGSTGSTTYTPLHGFYHDARTQHLFLASELIAAGMTPGTITQLALNVTSKASTIPYNGFTIKMGCTSATALTSAAYLTGASTVYGPQTITSSLGVNTYVLSSPFDWDGTSNIFVEFCFNNTSYTSSDAVAYTATPFVSTNKRYMDGGVGCTLTPSYSYSYRPNIRFTHCPAPAGAFTYTWSPSTSLSSSTVPNPTATPTSNTTYVVTVAGGTCTHSDTVNIFMCSTLPVEMLSFTGEALEKHNYLQWATASEINNSHFILERSTDARTFTPITRVEGAGFSNTTLYYDFTDREPPLSVAYYRLKQVDYDGSFEYSDVLSIERKKTGEHGLSGIYPNPTSGDLFITYTGNTGEEVVLQLMDITGKKIANRTYRVDHSREQFNFSLKDVAQGTYFLRLLVPGTGYQAIEKVIRY